MNLKIQRILILGLIFLGLVSTVCFAQGLQRTFYDQTNPENKISQALPYRDGFIFSGYFNCGDYVLARIDTAGKVIWDYHETDTVVMSSNNAIKGINLGDDGFLYVVRNGNYLGNQLWKVNPENGVTQWVYTQKLLSPTVRDLDSATLLVSFRVDPNTNWSHAPQYLAYIDKATGKETYRFQFGDTTSPTYSPYISTFVVVENSNIIACIKDSVIKFSGNNPGQRLWGIKMPGNFVMETVAHYDSATQAAYFVTNSLVIKYASNNSYTPIAYPGNGQFSASYGASFIRDGFIYTSWTSKNALGHAFDIQKHSITGDSLVWKKWVTKKTGRNDGGLAMNLDDSANVYVTGFSRSSDKVAGNWSVLKISENGQFLYDTCITMDTSRIDSLSKGVGIQVINGKIYALGQLQQFKNPRRRWDISFCLAELQSGSGEISAIKELPISDMRQSTVVKVIRYAPNKNYVLLHSGRQGILTLLDDSMRTQWSTTLERYNPLRPTCMDISPNGTIFIAGQTLSYECAKPPFYYAIDSTFLFAIDSNGIQRYAQGKWNGYSSFYGSALDVLAHSDTCAAIIRQRFQLEMVIWTPDSFYSPKYFPEYRGLLKTPYNTLEMDGDTIRGIAHNSSNKAFRLRYNIWNPTSYGVGISSILSLHHGVSVDSNRALLCGESYQGNTQWLLVDEQQFLTYWTLQIPQIDSMKVVKILADTQLGIAYIGAYQNSELILSKLEYRQAQVLWEQRIPSPLNQKYLLNDLAYDPTQQRILLTGTALIQNEGYNLTLLFDSSGTKKNHQVWRGNIPHPNEASRAMVWKEGMLLAAGNTSDKFARKSAYMQTVTGDNTYTRLDSFTCTGIWSPSGKQYWDSSGFYTDTLSQISGKDSILEVYLTLQSNASSIQARACYSYKSPSGKYTWNSNGRYFDTLINRFGCDSSIEIDLQIDTSTHAYFSDSACAFYISPNGKYWDQSGLYSDTLTNVLGCDSILHFNLLIHPVQYDSLYATACYAYESPSKKYTWTQSGTYSDTLVDAFGCDSILFCFIQLKGSDSSSLTVSECKSYQSPKGNYITQSGIYTDTFQNALGCDSILWLNVDIYPGSHFIKTVEQCNSYKSPSGRWTYWKTGVFYDTISMGNQCDSFFEIHVTIPYVNTGVTQELPKLISQATNAEYQWLDCFDKSILAGENKQEFNPSIDGIYQVSIKQNGCYDTSACYTVLNAGLAKNGNSSIHVYPNPFNQQFQIEGIEGMVEITLYDLTGKRVFKGYQDAQLEVKLPALSIGTYFLELKTNQELKRIKLIKH